MALTPFRWLALATIGCVVAALAAVSLRPGEPVFRDAIAASSVDTVEERMREVAGALNQTSQTLALRYRLLYLMDSVRRVAARLPDTGAMRVFIADGYTPRTRSAIEKTIREARSIRRGEASRVDLFVISDTTHFIRGVQRYSYGVEVRYEIPTGRGDRCRVYVRTGHPANVAIAFSSERASQQLLGTCGYFLAFGEPGPLVRQWLISGGWQYTVEGSWTKAAPFLYRGQDDPSIFKGPSLAASILNVESGGPECMKGALDVCERALTTPPVRRRWMASTGGATYALGLGSRRFYAGAIGYQAGEFLADAVREVGRERFKTFWTSTDSVPAAFQKATGERWGAFIQRWMIAHYGEIHPGPRMSGFALATSTILVLVALGVTMLLSVRRTYV